MLLNKFRTVSTSLLFLFVSSTHATNLDLSKVPLYLGGNVEPNVMFTLDDSGSMHWEYMPDDGWTYFVFPRATNVYGSSNYGNYLPVFDDISYSVRTRSSDINKIYYNPEVTYIPWSNDVGASMGNVSITCAPHNPADTAAGCRNLTVTNTQTANWETYNGDGSTFPGSITTETGASKSFWPAVYYRFNGGDAWTVANFTKVVIQPSTTSYTTAATRTDCASAPTCTYAEEIQNFANWYSYYRSRILLSRGGVGRAFAKQGSNMRVGFAAINEGSNTVDGVTSNGGLIRGVRPFSGSNRTTFFNDLYGHNIPTSGTPLRSALANVGNYFKRTDNPGPWGNTPGTNDTSTQLYCRQNYNILMTDGYWNGSSPSVGNSDGTAGSAISGPSNPTYTYSPAAPYSDTFSDTLADVGMEFWKQDLRTDLTNDVPTNAFDEAFWQHLVNFTVGLGVDGTLDETQALFDSNGNGITIAWPNPTSGNPQRIDDLWHTAVNSRGAFFSAADPDSFADSLSNILSYITERTSSASSASLNAGTVSASSQVYQAKFNTGDWSGQLLAFPINLNGTIGSQLWDAADKIPAANDRVILTHDGTTGQPFRWADISTSQQSLLGSENLLNYLRGDQSREVSNIGITGYRNRNKLLGDIIHSSPNYIAGPALRYPDGLGTNVATANYSAFKTTYANRTPMLYVSSNDGMLHGFDASPCPSGVCPVSSGKEVFAYVPNALTQKLPDLADVNYNHEYFADGSPVIIDAFFNSSWHTVLISGLRAGGQGIFALDITNPTSFATETSAKNNVLWEFTDTNDSDLGYTFGIPSVVKMHDGSWAAIFSGGYNNTYDDDDDGTVTNDSTTGNAVLYVVNVATGALIKKFDTQMGTAQDPLGQNRPNGLATPSIVDYDGDSVADAIYAGDLFGNVWKIDVSSNSTSNWDFSYSAGSPSKPIPIYTACADTSNCNASRQPITSQVQVTGHPSLPGYLVYFGTGQYFEVGDDSATGQVTQSFYGIWDKAEASLSAYNRASMLSQSITQEVSDFGFDLRITTDHTIDWSTHNGWYMDLINTYGGNTNNVGERQVTDAVIRNGRVIFATLVPSDDDCKGGGTSWLMELDQYSGSRLPYSPFSLDGNTIFDTSDYIHIDTNNNGIVDPGEIFIPASGKKSKVGIISTPSFINSEDGQAEYQVTIGADGKIEVTIGNPGVGTLGRQSWRQLDFNY